ncbi:MAG: efflux system, outer rane lipoprotein NodT family [Gammaproteobacteria bacterium]|jgi:NodT family efflux transporter outer membrane factor (OMF) lipoprotein|nr:efflux system, outer rane lipoprotein NodT family [Gammaproteobacteria bacterium]
MKPKLLLCALSAAAMLAACSLAPPYKTPVTAPPAASYKEASDWKPAHPADAQPRGTWWNFFHDSQLDALEAQVTTSNQNLKAAFARLEQARAQMRFQRASYLPTVTAGVSGSRTRTSINAPQYSTVKPATQNNLLLQSDLSYEIDVFGRVRNSVAAARASADASAADLAVVDLSMHSELALDYFTLRSEDTQQSLLDRTVTDYTRALELTQNLYNGGAVPLADVAQAQAQLETARTQAEDVRLRRAQTEHAIAVLVDQQASSFHLDPQPLSPDMIPPPVDPGLPSELLERRPDVAGAERRVASANASIGVARAAYFPVFSLAAGVGFESTHGFSLIDAPSALWALGSSAVMTVFDGGRRHAQTDQARAVYDEQVANYRTTVSTAYSDVEDWLVALRQLERESMSESAAVAATATELEQANYRYKAGAATYLEVVIAENASLAAQLSAADIQVRRMNASVLLVKALGGGWENSTPAGALASR